MKTKVIDFIELYNGILHTTKDLFITYEKVKLNNPKWGQKSTILLFVDSAFSNFI